jgi:transcriptional regulator with XRE-family HTH domain
MLFSDKIRQLREEKQLLQRQVSAFLEMDNALYCKIERGDRPVKREQVKLLAKLFSFDESELLKLWLADKVYNIVAEEGNASEVLNIVSESIIEYNKTK